MKGTVLRDITKTAVEPRLCDMQGVPDAVGLHNVHYRALQGALGVLAIHAADLRSDPLKEPERSIEGTVVGSPS